MYSLKRACGKLLGRVSRKTLMLILALALTLTATAGGTLAFLYGTQSVRNTFAYSASTDISIDLEETDTGLDADANPDTNEYPMFPGQDIVKDPTVTVHAGSLDCWLFVEMNKFNFDAYMEYTMEEGWTELPDYPGVFYRGVAASAQAQAFPVIAGNVVHVKPGVTLSMLYSLTNADYPTLTITAYAIQRDSGTAADAWALLRQTVQ